MQSSLKLFALYFSCLLFQKNANGATPQSWEIQAVKVLPQKSGSLTLSYQPTCGSSFGGIILRSEGNSDLRVGVMTRRSHARCSHLLGMETLRVPQIQVERFRTIKSYSPTTEPAQLKVLPLQNSYAAISKHGIGLELTYTSHCGKQIGLFLRAETTGLRLGLVEGGRDERARCNRLTEAYRVKGVELDPTTSLLLDPLEGDSKATSYSVRRIPVQVTEAQQHQTNMKHTIVFYRRCHEAPIGLIQENLGARKIALSLMVASYPNSICPQNTPQMIWSSWEEGFITDPKNKVIAASVSKDEGPLRVARPLSYQWLVQDGETVLQLVSYQFCSRNIGMVVRSSFEGLAVGMVQRQSAKPCKSSLERVSYAYSWKGSDTSEKDVKPLQLLGSH